MCATPSGSPQKNRKMSFSVTVLEMIASKFPNIALRILISKKKKKTVCEKAFS